MGIIKSHLLHAEVCGSPQFPPCLVLAAHPRALAPREPAEASGGDTCQSHPCLWGAHMAPADSSPTQGSSGGVVMKGINAGTWKKKICYFVVRKILVSDTACYYNCVFLK